MTLKIIQQFLLYRLLAHKKRQELKHKVLFPLMKISFHHFISPDRFARLFYEDYNNDNNEGVTNNINSTKTPQNDQINKENFARKYNNNDKNKNAGTLEVVINQYSEKQTAYPRKSIVPGTNSYSNTLANSQTNSHNIKIFIHFHSKRYAYYTNESTN